jgi:hypothetical protein
MIVNEHDALGAADGEAFDPGGLDPEAFGSGVIAPAVPLGSAERPRGHARVVAGVLLVAVALTGIVGGVVLDQWMLSQGWIRPGRIFGVDAGPGPRRGPRSAQEERQRLSEFYTRELALTPSQRERIDVIVGAQVADVHAVWTQMRPRMDSVIERTRVQIEKTLTPEQSVKFRALRERRDRRLRGGGLGPQ